MPHQNGSHHTGPIRTTVARRGADRSLGRSASLAVTAQAAAATGTYTINDVDAEIGDVVCVSPSSTPQAGLIIASAHVSAIGVISVRIVNGSAGALTAGAQPVVYWICR